MEDIRNDFDAIMREITSGLTGEAKHDGPYLMEQMQKYKSHGMATEIVRACGRLLAELVPADKKEELQKMLEKNDLGTKAVLDEVQFNIFKGDFKKALVIIEDLVRKIEAVDMYHDDMVSEYHTFNETFEEVLFRFRHKPQKDIRQADIRYSEIYTVYGSLLVELKDFERAKAVLKTALRWNPMSAAIYFEYTEIFKMTGDYEEFFRLTLEGFRMAFHPADLARCYRNLGFYFIEKELYPEAAGCYYMSTMYEPDSKQAMSELYYISTKTGKNTAEPSRDEIEKYSKKYGFPIGADEDVLGLAYAHGMHFYKEKEYSLARYFLGILYGLTRDGDIKKLLDSIEQKMN